MCRPTFSRVASSLTHATPFASSSRCFYATKPAAASSSSSSGFSYLQASPTDSRMDLFKHVLYPLDGYAPKSAAPTGAHHPDHLARLAAVVPNSEVHETIERAFKLFQRHKRAKRQAELRVKYKAMTEACDELDKITMPLTKTRTKAMGEDVIEPYDRAIFVEAVKRPDPYKRPKHTGRRISSLEIWKEARIEGLMPRETWVPTETRGKGWNYDWQMPADN